MENRPNPSLQIETVDGRDVVESITALPEGWNVPDVGDTVGITRQGGRSEDRSYEVVEVLTEFRRFDNGGRQATRRQLVTLLVE